MTLRYAVIGHGVAHTSPHHLPEGCAGWISIPAHDGKPPNFARNYGIRFLENQDYRDVEHVIYVDDVDLCVGFFDALVQEYEHAIKTFDAPVWMSPRYLPRFTSAEDGMRFAKEYGICTDEQGFRSAPPFSTPVTNNGHRLSTFITSREAMRAVMPFDEEYRTNTWADIDLGLDVLSNGHYNVLSWDACVVESFVDTVDMVNEIRKNAGHDIEYFRSTWGQESYEAFGDGTIWKDLRSGQIGRGL